MRFLFKNGRNKKAGKVNEDRFIESLALFTYRLQSKWAVWMGGRTSGYSTRRWSVLLSLFVLLACGYSSYKIITGYTGKGKVRVPVSPISRPARIIGKLDPAAGIGLANEGRFERIKKFSQYMDSLGRSPSGKAGYDSIIRARPGLLDSVRLIERYDQQSKND